MPTDTRRLQGPEETKSPYSLAQLTLSPTKAEFRDTRVDGRKNDEVRPIFLKAGVISQAKGSAYIEQDKTKIICAVYGPREVARKEDFTMKGTLNCEFKYATFSCKIRRQHQQDLEEKDLSVQLLEALEPSVRLDTFPKSQVDVYVMVLQSDGGALAASVTCASVALANAGIEMYDLVVGCSVRVAEDSLVLDPTINEEYNSKVGDKYIIHSATVIGQCIFASQGFVWRKVKSKPLASEDEEDTPTNHGSLMIGLMPSLNQISAITSCGEIQVESMKKAVRLCSETCQKIYPVLQQCLVNSLMHQDSSPS